MNQKIPEGNFQDQPLYVALPQLLHQYFSCCFIRLDKLGVHPGQVPLLLNLRDAAGCTQAELSRRLHIKAPTVTVMLDKMERLGLVERRQDPADKRKLRIYLTGDGQRLTAQAHEIVQDLSDALMKGVEKEELEAVQGVIGKMKQNLDDLRASDPELCRPRTKAPPEAHFQGL